MPLIEFACKKCGKKIEELVRSSSDAKAPSCPSCGGEMVRAWSAFATVGKSSGGGGGCGQSHGGGFS